VKGYGRRRRCGLAILGMGVMEVRGEWDMAVGGSGGVGSSFTLNQFFKLVERGDRVGSERGMEEE